MPEFTRQQKAFLELVQTGQNVFLSGGAGTGKTYVLKEAMLELQFSGKNVIVCAPTGAAAMKCEGTTIHRVFKLRSTLGINDVKHTPVTHTSELLEHTDVVVIDEISMVRMDIFDAVTASLSAVQKKTGRPVQLIVSGDFYQLPPVINNKQHERVRLEQYYGRPIGNAFAFQADSWKTAGFQTVVLDQAMRQNDSEFVSRLLKIRTGDASELTWFEEHSSRTAFPNGLYLCATNSKADAINRHSLQKIPGESRIYQSSVSGNVLESEKVAQSEIELKIGTRIITTVNNSHEQYYNGSTGVVTDLRDKYIRVRFDNSVHEVSIPYYTWHIYEYILNELNQITVRETGSFSQLPVKLAYAITIHRSQGATYSNVNLHPVCWESGQLYVAISRVKSIEGLHFDEKLKSSYLRVDPAVESFYTSLRPLKPVTNAGVRKHTAAGRPSQYGRKTKTIRIPVELEKSLKTAMNTWAEDPANRTIICVPNGTSEKESFKRDQSGLP